MKKNLMYIAVVAMVLVGTGCSNTDSGSSKTSAATAQAAVSSQDTQTQEGNAKKFSENLIIGKVKSVADGTLTLETRGGDNNGGDNKYGNNNVKDNDGGNGKGGQNPDGSGGPANPPKQPADSNNSANPSKQPNSIEQTVKLTENTVYYKESNGTNSEASLSDVTTDSMVQIEFNKDDSGSLTAKSVTIMDSSMMKNRPDTAPGNAVSSAE